MGVNRRKKFNEKAEKDGGKDVTKEALENNGIRESTAGEPEKGEDEKPSFEKVEGKDPASPPEADENKDEATDKEPDAIEVISDKTPSFDTVIESGLELSPEEVSKKASEFITNVRRSPFKTSKRLVEAAKIALGEDIEVINGKNQNEVALSWQRKRIPKEGFFHIRPLTGR